MFHVVSCIKSAFFLSGPTHPHTHTHSHTIIIIMYIYHALINVMSAHMIHFNLNMIFYTHVEHSPTKTIYVKPVLNWANISSRTYLEVFGEASWFLIGPTFLREPSWKYSSKLYSGSKNLRSTCSGNIRPIGRSLPLIG